MSNDTTPESVPTPARWDARLGDWLTKVVQEHKPFVIVILVIAGALMIGGLAAANDKDDPAPSGRKMSLTEAACSMLNDGDSPDFTYEVMEDLADEHPYTYPDSKAAARLAVAAAQAKGCG